MNKVRVSIHRKEKLFVNGWKALSLFSKMKGLLGTGELKEGDGLLIPGCKQVHTYFMKYPIDVIFLDSQNVVIKHQTLNPWKCSPWILKAQSVLEVPAGYASKNELQSGEMLEVKLTESSHDPA
jgi:uncharacterized membrane protein (UPF0127 family)